MTRVWVDKQRALRVVTNKDRVVPYLFELVSR